MRKADSAFNRRLNSFLLVISSALLLCACDFAMTTVAPTPTATLDDLSALRQRPLHLPSLPSGAPCPRVQFHEVSPDVAPVIGAGPAYAAGFENGVLPLAPSTFFGGGDYGGNKVAFFVAPTYRGPVLVRGEEVNGHHDMRFGDGAEPRKDDLFTADGYNPGGWSAGGSYTRVMVPGCYAYQFDNKGFSETIIFQAVLSS